MTDSTLIINDIRCEYRDNPIGIDEQRPRFSWKLAGDGRNMMQSAYHIEVHEEGDGALVWDSGKRMSDQSVLVEYDGEALKPQTVYSIRVKTWDNAGRESGWTASAFETGLLHPSERWTAEWISGDDGADEPSCDYLRTSFRIQSAVRRARLYATACGMYEMYLNGTRVGDSHFTPGWTNYKQRIQYQTYDVTALLRQGHNGLGGVVGDGWYRGELGWKDQKDIYGKRRALSALLHIWYEDGTEDVVSTDGSWSGSEGPIRSSSIYHGEVYDARLELGNWSAPDYEAAGWLPVWPVEALNDRLLAQVNEPVRRSGELSPVSLIVTPEGDQVLDFGQNMVGWVRMRISQAAAGDSIILHHAEVLDKEGNFYTDNLRSAKQEIRYICKGGEEEVFEPHFTFQGFRYVRVTGYPGDIALERFTAIVLHSDMEQAGTFECSDSMLNQLQSNIVWGQKGNFVDVPTDCPQRDERLGWTGDAQVFIRTAAYNRNVAPFFTKWLQDLSSEQLPNGGVPFVIPDVLGGDQHSSAAWGDAATVCPWTIYQMYGDKRVLARQYGSMKAWVEYMRAQGDTEALWNTGFHFGDWLGMDAKEGSYIGATPQDLIATAFYAYSTELLAKSAEALGYAEDAAEYGALYESIVQAFRDEFVTANGRLVGPFQTAYVLALQFGLLEEKHQSRAIRELVKLIEDNKGCMTTGFVGTPYLCLALSGHGRSDWAYNLVLNKQYPSWLYSIEQGATTIWEHWDGIKPDGTFWSKDMNSYNHYAYGSVGEWLFRKAAGIDMAPEAPGFKRIVIAPEPDARLTYVKASYASPYGEIRSQWQLGEDGQLTVDVTIPANTTAAILLPGANPDSVSPEGQARQVNGGMQLEIGSGSYTWTYAYSVKALAG
ncbi:glycoside hydrolase family 78 protein [Paenibacillus sp. J5C_2022]|uniref:glycoside hydrolase family 78 protein n=1 Tax=Paenibacillus sp. J5C2022 TaxID=2977129 RepID=UPI0021D01BDC|nr:glycoside hydrolase family 78 protein [Paenibacillus sp. J5C2022]MCU6709164.1 glycoside hydrolase family 78 protein [Paenibacillus sp. J5C2022]